jgi:hypothetical protein
MPHSGVEGRWTHYVEGHPQSISGGRTLRYPSQLAYGQYILQKEKILRA